MNLNFFKRAAFSFLSIKINTPVKNDKTNIF